MIIVAQCHRFLKAPFFSVQTKGRSFQIPPFRRAFAKSFLGLTVEMKVETEKSEEKKTKSVVPKDRLAASDSGSQGRTLVELKKTVNNK